MATQRTRVELHADDEAFESEVRRVAKLIYPMATGGAKNIAGLERDGVFETDDMVILIEATTSRQDWKAEKDGKKLKALADSMARAHPYKGVKAFFVTKDDVQPGQSAIIQKIGQPVTAISFHDFKARVIDTRGYLDARSQMLFGSARDPEDDGQDVKGEFVEVSFSNVVHPSETLTVGQLVDRLLAGKQTVILGEFGAGKSMALREVFLNVRTALGRRQTEKFAIHLNLNQHLGQVQPAEALVRHANVIGFEKPDQLTRAWRSGFSHLLLDGFDEVLLFAGPTGPASLADVRRRGVALVSKFIDLSPKGTGIIVAGREHYFDDLTEAKQALGVNGDALFLRLSDFTDLQVQRYLESRSWQVALPGWLPRRPLLIGYLAGRQLFPDMGALESVPRGVGWNRLLDGICDREAEPRDGEIGSAIRFLIERLASVARTTVIGVGPLAFQQLINVFREIRGELPDASQYAMLERLPGLRAVTGSEAREFIDDDMADAFRAGDVARIIFDPDRYLTLAKGWTFALGQTGLEVLADICDEAFVTDSALDAALKRASTVPELEMLKADIVRLMHLRGSSPSVPTAVHGVYLPSLVLSDGVSKGGVSFSDCVIDSLDLSDVGDPSSMPYFSSCLIGEIVGVAGLDELDNKNFQHCEIGDFSEGAENASAILRLNISDERRVTLTLLRKIYGQSGAARKDSGLTRGALSPKQRMLVPECLRQLEKHGVVRSFKRKGVTYWEQVRGSQTRVAAALDSPVNSTDEILPLA